MRRYLPLLALVAIASGVFALGSLRRGSDDKPLLNVAEEMPLTVVVAQPERREIVKLVQAPGDVEAVLEVEISSEIVAKIEEMPIEENSLVKKGGLFDVISTQVENFSKKMAEPQFVNAFQKFGNNLGNLALLILLLDRLVEFDFVALGKPVLRAQRNPDLLAIHEFHGAANLAKTCLGLLFLVCG